MVKEIEDIDSSVWLRLCAGAAGGASQLGVFWFFFTFPTARRQKESAIKPKVNFLVFNVNSVQPGLEDVRHPNST